MGEIGWLRGGFGKTVAAFLRRGDGYPGALSCYIFGANVEI